jgi:hypothetical protein
MTPNIARISLPVLALAWLTPAAGIAEGGQSALPFALGGAIGTIQQMQQQQFLLQQQQTATRQQATAAWSQLGPAILGCISQNYRIDGPQFGFTYSIFPNDARYVGMVQQCAAIVVQEQQRQRELAEQQWQRQGAERQQQLQRRAERELQQREEEKLQRQLAEHQRQERLEAESQVRSEGPASSNWPLRGLPPPSEPASTATLEKLRGAGKTGWRLQVIGSPADNKYVKYTDATVFSDSIVIHREETVLGSKPDTYPFSGEESGCVTSDFANTIPASAGSNNIPINRIEEYIPKSTYIMVQYALICPYADKIAIEVSTYGEYVGEGARFYHTQGFPCVTGRYGGCNPPDKSSTGLVRFLLYPQDTRVDQQLVEWVKSAKSR